MYSNTIHFKMNQNLIFALIILIVIVGGLFYLNKENPEQHSHHKKHPENFGDAGWYVTRDLPTSPEVEFIEGTPNTHVVDEADGMEIIREGDITLSPGFGVGEGLVGFGRYGSSFMV